MLELAKRPLFWLGAGIRLSGAVDLIEPFLERFQVPCITSWQGKDMLRHDHPLFYGHAGVYGHPSANRIVQQADMIISIGTRLAIPQIGYDRAKFASNAKLVVVDIDYEEAKKLNPWKAIVQDCGSWMREFMRTEPACDLEHSAQRLSWHMLCDNYKEEYPARYPECRAGYVNPYHFMKELNKWLKPDQVIVTDMGTALLCAYPALKLNGKQRLITSTGLGEMGFGLPAAIGAALSCVTSEVLCLNCDGGMMFNLQELATIQHHNLPIKIVVFCNDGYNMIKATQDTLGMERVASTEKDLSFPNWQALADSFDIHSNYITGLNSHALGDAIGAMMNYDGSYLLEVWTDPEQKFGPKLSPVINTDGSIYSPGLEEIQ